MPISIPYRRYLGPGLTVAGAFLAAGLLVKFLGRGSAIAYKSAPATVQMRLVELPPPPPPPPPPQQKMVEVQKQPEFTEQPPPEATPAPANDEPAPAAPGPLGLDAQGQGPADGFGLAGRPGGSGVIGSGGSGGDRFTWYSALVQGRVSQALQQQRRLYDAKYAVPVMIWINPDGSVQRVELVESSGRPEIDRLLVRAIESMPKLPQPPPEGMPQPITARISAT